ncbi:DUF294 nucleotidyltransferase-like domain-containing protein [Ferrimonas aestuarii]|uniref:CBS domain-containing protein n=1 Tax=Ferrimonas aestuarii TaxID=2569539 RepID=A0A4U1BRE1_9GAMM|nr:DUF294 nucleotidyltransferase-like domain-containing protein [Ferrimonas aestuarii]TKB57330.1 CBS domain-containing protein [Ferrimonas aestuarii]
MTSGLESIEAILAASLPFTDLSADERRFCAGQIQIVYVSRRQQWFDMTAHEPALYLIATGAIELISQEQKLLARLEAQQSFGFQRLLTGQESSVRVKVIEDSLLYLIPQSVFDRLRQSSRQFDQFYNQQLSERVRVGERSQQKSAGLSARLSSLMSTPVITAEDQMSVQAVATLMSDNRISGMPVVDGGGEMVGIITDRDLRRRVVAEGRSLQTPLNQVMTRQVRTLPPQSARLEAQLLMTEWGVHHLPVVEDRKVVGMITSSDLLRQVHWDPAHFIKSINRSDSLEALRQQMDRLPKLIRNLDQPASGFTSRLITAVYDAVTRRLLILAQQQFGPAPLRWCWLSFGSQARREMGLNSDQDNGLVFEREPNGAEAEYFERLSTWVCDGLAVCGQRLCDGEIMASNSKWRLSLNQWQGQFANWLENPEPKAVMHCAIFFDMRPIEGELQLASQLHQQVVEQAKVSERFLALLAQQAASRQPPLGLFRRWVLDSDGQQHKGIDIKHRALAIVNDIARIYALSGGCEAIETELRLKAAMERGQLTRVDALNLADCLSLLRKLKYEHHCRQLAEGSDYTNLIEPKALSQLSRHQLKQALKVLAEAQDSVKFKFARQF